MSKSKKKSFSQLVATTDPCLEEKLVKIRLACKKLIKSLEIYSKNLEKVRKNKQQLDLEYMSIKKGKSKPSDN